MAARCFVTRSTPGARGIMLLAALLLAALLLAALLLVAPPVHAQQAASQTFHACYVPASGTVYRIREPGLRTNCHASSHVEFSWAVGPDGEVLKPGDAAGGDLAGAFPSPSVSGLRGRPVSADAPAVGQMLLWNGTSWTPASPPSGVTTHADLSGLSADDHPQYVLVDGARPLLGDLHAGGNRITNLAAANAPGQAVVFQQAIKVGDAAGGDVGGTFPSLSVSGLRGRPLSADAPAVGQMLLWNGTSWTPASPPSGVTTHADLSGLSADDHPQYLLADGARPLVGDLHAGANRITNLGAATAPGQAVVFQQAIKVGDAAGGDVGGTFPSLAVQRLQGHLVSSTAPQNGEVLSYNASASRWEPRQPYRPNTHVEAIGEVLANGTTGSGAVELTSTRIGTGRYRITFPQYRTSNRYTVDVTVMGAAPGFANVVQFVTGGIDIFTFDHTGAAADRHFMVSVQRYPL